MKSNFGKVRINQDDNIVSVTLTKIESHFYIDESFIQDFDAFIDHIEEHHSKKIIILRGFDNPGFDEVNEDPDIFRKWAKNLKNFYNLKNFKIGIVEKECTGLHLQILLNCNYRIGTKAASFYSKELRYGLLPGLEILNLVENFGLVKLKDFVLHGKEIKAVPGCKLGLLQEVVAKEQISFATRVIIQTFIDTPKEAYFLADRLINETLGSTYENSLGSYLAAQNKCLSLLT